LGYVVGAALALLAVFGFIGFSNLRDFAVDSARSQMQKEVTKQVQEKLTTENINKIVKEQIRDVSVANLDLEIRKDLTSPPLSNSIRQAADEEAQGLMRKQYSPRHFSPAQSKKLIDELEQMKDLDGYAVCVAPAMSNVEAINYASEIKQSLSKSKMALEHLSYCCRALNGSRNQALASSAVSKGSI
jgi:hypothetical protein